ncbi:MAG: rod shape-determining protein RodA [Phycisphaerae bacterium]|nr:rod shape-determining protein RodA [Phycisphaerae bacterium]
MFKFLEGRILFTRLLLLLAASLLVIAGVATIYAIGHPAGSDGDSVDSDLANNWVKQVQFAVLGLAAFIAVNVVSYRRIGEWSFFIFAAVLGLLGVILFARYFVDLPFVPVINGTRRWIRIHPSLPSIQPSEFFKIAYIVALGWYLRYRSNYRSFKSLIGPLALTVLPSVMILLEPDLGTVMLMWPVLFVMLFVAGARAKHLLCVIGLGLLLSPVMWHFIEQYQRVRISSVLLQSEKVREFAAEHPSVSRVLVGRDNFSSSYWQRAGGYHLIRSKYAICTGGLRGNGFGEGLFIRYNFLPERHNDFIFAAIAHQWGFLGCLCIYGLYAIVFVCGLSIAVNNTDPFGRLVAVGICAMLAIEVIVNSGMSMGLMPITGLTLPLVSYGGSSLMMSMICIGLLNNIGRSRKFCAAGK